MRRLLLSIALVFALSALTTASLRAGGDCCECCGCCAPCEKVCRLVCETKKVTKVTYDCVCEDFCVPGPSDRCVTYDCDCDCHNKRHIHYTPTCATVRTRTKLVKYEKVEEKPSYKWVVEYVCPPCASKCACETATLQQDMAVHQASAASLPTRDTQPPAPTSKDDSQPKSQLRRVLDSLSGSR